MVICTYKIEQTQKLKKVKTKKKSLLKKCSPSEKFVLLILSVSMQTKMSCYTLILSLLKRMPVVLIMIIYLCRELEKNPSNYFTIGQ